MVGGTRNGQKSKGERIGEVRTMKFQSQGLGENWLNLPIGEAKMVKEGDLLFIKGRMGPPVYWDFKVTLREQDFKDIFLVAQKPNTAGFIIKSENHWGVYFTMIKEALKFVLMNVIGLVKTSFSKRSCEQKETTDKCN
jgi:hypothetical protein